MSKSKQQKSTNAFAPQKKVLSVRIDHEVLVMAKDAALKLFGDENKVGALVENALKVYINANLNAPNAGTLLAAVEDAMLISLKTELRTIEKNIHKRLTGLVARTAYDTAFLKAEREGHMSKTDIDKYKKVMSERMSRRLEDADATEIAHLHNEILALETQLRDLKEIADSAETKVEKQKNVYVRELKNMEQKVNDRTQQVTDLQREMNTFIALKKWVQQLEQHLKSNAKGTIGNRNAFELLTEFTNSNPRPGS